MIMSICDDIAVLSIFKILKLFINIIKVVVPIILIFTLMIKLAKAVTSQNDDLLANVKKSAPSNIIAAVLIFLVPTFVNLITGIAFPNSDYTTCFNNANDEKIKEIAKSNVEEKINNFKKSLNINDYIYIEKELKYIDGDSRKEYESEIDNIKKYIDILNEIKNIKKSKNKKKYLELVDIVKNIEDEDIKAILQEALDEYKDNFFAYDPIKPNANENVIKSEETETLKVYITKENSYYITRVRAENPYEQLNKQNANPYGKKLSKPSDLLADAVNEKNLQNKLMIGFNASGFYLKDTYDASSVNYYAGYDKTSVGTLVITDGKVIRNQYQKGDLITWFITGVNTQNKMVVFEDKKMKETNVTEKKAWSESVINSGIRNTFTFAAPLILDGKTTNYNNNNSRMPGSNSSKKGLQLICQINDNNFVLFTSSNSTRDTGIEKFLSLGCKTAVNLDGGGSVALLFKSSRSSSFEIIMGNGRSLPEVGYFSE